MTVERHLILQELTLLPAAEWIPRSHGWMVARVSGGTGYWLQSSADRRELDVGDGLVVLRTANGTIRASQLGSLRLQFFMVRPTYLTGLLTVAEWHRLEVAPQSQSASISFFTASDPVGQTFTRLMEAAPAAVDSVYSDAVAPRPKANAERLYLRCALLQLWANAVSDWLDAPGSGSAYGNKLRDHFRELVDQMTEAELAECSLADLSGQLRCSERHFSRLFRDEFGMPFRTRQIELRLQHARELLGESKAKIINVAHDCGYRHLGLFNATFKKRFGLTPSEWRQQNLGKSFSVPARIPDKRKAV